MKLIANLDEVGRGCLFGDVVAAAVIIPETWPDTKDTYLRIRDSKKIPAKERKILDKYIKTNAIAYAIGSCTPAEIDEMNILQATYTAMHRALDELSAKLAVTGLEISELCVDGNSFRAYHHIPYKCIVGGDAINRGIGAASILAKQYRDNSVLDYIAAHPEHEVYGLATNMGYGTAKHIDAIKKYGVLPLHRRSFAPIKSLVAL
jgi:ribonuclease HII